MSDAVAPPVSSFPLRLALAGVSASLLAVSVAEADTRHVPSVYPRITDALAASVSGDTIQVAPGTYSTSANGEAFPRLLNRTDLVLSGAGMDVTTLDAENQNAVVRIESTGCRVSGFLVTGGCALEGGGVRIASGGAEVDHNLILGNSAEISGSGVFINTGATIHLHHNIVWESTDIDTAIAGDPHGVQFRSSGGLVEYNVVGRGDSNGLLVNSGSNPIIRNNMFVENGMPSPLRGRGICNLTGSEAIIAYNLFFGNQVAALLAGTSDVSAEEANAFSPTDSIYGNIDADPEFISADALDLHLRSTSPAIDAGDPSSPLDPDGTRADIGPFYFDQSVLGLPDGKVAPSPLSAHPNPFQLSTAFRFALERPGRVAVRVFDVRGRLVATLLDEERSAGEHQARWDGRRLDGDRASSGVYFVRLETAEGTRLGKVALLP